MNQTPQQFPLPPPHRRVFCNRTLNLRGIRAIGYDMDYTLIHYKVEEWERHAYNYAKSKLLKKGWPIEHVEFAPDLIIRGLVIDTQRGNLLKVNRFGYVKSALHGTAPLDFETQRQTYSRTVISLSDKRYNFLNTLFSLSEACLFMQLVDLLDLHQLPGVMGYSDLYEQVRSGIDAAHLEGILKAEIMADPDRFVELDAEMPITLLDQKRAGKKLMLITNSEWSYTSVMMTYVFDRFLPNGMTWRDLFDVIIVSARKPDFFSQRNPLFQVVNEEGLLTPVVGGLKDGGIYLGGDAYKVEDYLNVPGDLILYVGDHIWGDVQVSKSVLRWRTALILRELESDLAATELFANIETQLEAMMATKEQWEYEMSQVRLQLQRKRSGYGVPVETSEQELQSLMLAYRTRLVALDEKIAPIASASAQLNNARWGLMMRAGNDKSLLARQIERYADIYMSRVSNFLFQTPFVYLRSPRGNLPHDLTV